MDITEQFRILQEAQGDSAKLALATVDIAYPALPENERATLKDTLKAAAIPHWCDETILAALLEIPPSGAIIRFDHLRSLKVVEPFPARGLNAVNVHEATRLALRKQIARDQPDYFYALSARAQAYFKANTTPAGRIEWIYHFLVADSDTGAAACGALTQAQEWASQARPEDQYALALALNELETSRLVTGRVSKENIQTKTKVDKAPLISWGNHQINKIALIDSQPLSRIHITYLLERNTPAKRRSEDFIVLPFASSEELLSTPEELLPLPEELEELLTDSIGNYYKVGLIIFNIGEACASEEKVRDDIHRLRQGLPAIPLAILSERNELYCIREALRAGVHSYIPTTLNPFIMLQALRLIQVGGRFIPTNACLEFAQEGLTAETGNNLNAAKLETMLGLTQRQLEVFQLLRKGKSSKVIAFELKMQESTVKVHVRHIRKKMRKLKAREFDIGLPGRH
jgi:DNA-binding NarL/FixJ family response regulator